MIMAELLSPEEYQDNELLEPVESRFGDKPHIEQILRDGDAHILGSADELLDIEKHQNTVQLAEILATLQENEPRNIVKHIFFDSLDGNQQRTLGIFKPFSGENPYVHEQYHNDRFDVREVLAYEISEHFGFDLVPPTVHREINGEIGSLQLFMPTAQYQTIEWVEKHSHETHFDFARDSVDWEVLAAFDYILANPDRHARNVLVEYAHDHKQNIIVPQGDYGATLIAIDNGTSLSTAGYYDHDVTISGPNVDMTYSLDERKPLALEIPDYLLAILKQGLANRAELHLERYNDTISPTELQAVWQRAEDLVKQKVFLSRYNERHVFGY